MYVFVLGMHRAGTSATAGILNIAGGWVGEILNPARDNPKGFFENKEFVRINQALLRANGGRWDNPPKNVDFKGIKPRMVKFLDSLPPESVIVLKDPRAALTFHLWRELIPKGDIRVITVKRDPESIAKSLQRRNGFAIKKGKDLTHHYNTKIAMNLLLMNRDYIYTFHFIELFTNYKEFIIEKMVETAGLPELTQAKWDKIGKFIDPKLRHFK